MFNEVYSSYRRPHGKIWNLCSAMMKEHHVCIAGTTGSGKSVFLRSFLFTAHQQAPCEQQFMYIDLKRVELVDWKFMPHCMDYADSVSSAEALLADALDLMETRYKRMAARGQRTYEGGSNVWIVIDEVADLLHTSRTALQRLCELGRLGRAAKIHLLICTQNPSRSSGGGLPAPLIQNMTCCIALRCRSAIESRQIIGTPGAELLPRYGKGIMWNSDGTQEVIIPMTDEAEVIQRQDYWKTNYGKQCRFAS